MAESKCTRHEVQFRGVPNGLVPSIPLDQTDRQWQVTIVLVVRIVIRQLP